MVFFTKTDFHFVSLQRFFATEERIFFVCRLILKFICKIQPTFSELFDIVWYKMMPPQRIKKRNLQVTDTK